MDYTELIKELKDFVKSKNWEKYHNLKDLALSVSIESSELLEIFQWKNPDNITENDKENIKDELADILTYSFYICDKLGLSPIEIVKEKLEKNKKREFKV